MDQFCRGCLVRYEEPTDLLQYTEKNRRLFVYCTGLQVKRTDTFTFQLCRGCYVNMKVACNFKKQSRNSDRLFKSYQSLKDNGESLDLSTFLKNNDDSWTFRFPGNSTPAYQRARDDDNESTTTSIRNFMNDIMPEDDLPDTEARIIKEVIDEEADVLDDSLDSHWLQDEASIDSDFRLDFSFSPFSTPRPVNNDRYTPKKQTETSNAKTKGPKAISTNFLESLLNKPKHLENEQMPKSLNNLDMPLIDDRSNSNSFPPITEESSQVKPSIIENLNQDSMLQISIKQERNLDETMDSLDVVNEFLKYENDNFEEAESQCTIDRNLEDALKNTNNKEFSLDELLVSPKVMPEIKSPATPFINNLLFSEKLDIDENSNSSQKYKTGQCIETFENVKGEVDIVDEFSENIDIKLEDELDIEELKTEILGEFDKEASPEKENNFNITNFYCNMCQKKFASLRGLQRHSKLKHSTKVRLPRILICDICGSQWNNRTNFVRHMRRHQPPALSDFNCDVCKLEFCTPDALKKHKRTHAGEKTAGGPVKKKFVCPECGATTDKASNHRVHMMRHNKDYKHKCPECSKGFYRLAELTVHMRYHTGEKPFKCQHCPKSFVRRDMLTKHTKHHLDLRPFKCVHCNSRFINNYNLKNHLKQSKRCTKEREVVFENQRMIDDNRPKETVVISYSKKVEKKKVTEEIDENREVTEELLENNVVAEEIVEKKEVTEKREKKKKCSVTIFL
ncbi:zinc finger protein 777-like isoform X2 [Leguminivora glycinivorella]|uniref:zinc finger protein 777-like isoform X2 n=1 Tax=Leguminivora glycinivorella TaxID=1035111 RepID=UPI00200CED3D|nr:zinc finger protein 777-like isoform X2 [Leguminivora glycinivorella]